MKDKLHLLIFDVNETLLDLSPLKEAINQAFENDSAFENWFSLLLQYAMVESMTGQFKGFGEIGKAAFEMLAKKNDKRFQEEDVKQVLSWIRKLPPHTDVKKGLELIKEQDIKMVALTNGTMEAALEQLKFAGLDHYFEKVFSVEQVKTYKPHPSTYHYVLRAMNVKPSDAIMVACHAWDITGAQRAGLKSCFLIRKGMSWYPLEKSPDYLVKTLIEFESILKGKL